MNKKVTLSIQIGLGVVVAVLVFVLAREIMLPLNFRKQVEARSNDVIERIIQIRSAQQAFKEKNKRYTASFDSLIDFVLRDSLQYERKLVDDDDSVGLAMLKRSKRANVVKFMAAVRDTVFVDRDDRHIVLSTEQIKNMRYIPHAEQDAEYILGATLLTTESKVVVPVFEAKAPYKAFLGDLNKQQLINLIDSDKNTLNKYPGIVVGSIERATNDAGNWE